MVIDRMQRGSVILMVAGGITALIGATALAVDIGYFFLVKNQLQNAADAAATAGAKGLIVDPGNYTDSGKARVWATEYAGKNEADGHAVTLTAEEITFCNIGWDGSVTQCETSPMRPREAVRVTIVRNVQTFFGSIFGISEVSVGVDAAAAMLDVCGGIGSPSGGWRPFAIPDQFANHESVTRVRTRDFGQPYVASEVGTCSEGCPTPLSCTEDPAMDWYMSPYDEGLDGTDMAGEGDFGTVTGYIAMRDVIDLFYLPVTLKVGSPSTSIAPGQFYPITFPPNVRSGGGGAEYRDNIVDGWFGQLQVGDFLYLEPGNMIGPTKQGIVDLINLDPGAHLVLKDGSVKIEGSIFEPGLCPRVIPVAMFDPSLPPGPGRDFIQVTNIGGFFVRQMSGNDICGTFLPTHILGSPGSGCTGGGGRLGVTVQLIQ